MWTGEMEVLNGKKEKVASKKYIQLLTAVHTGYYPYMILKKMNQLRLEDFVTRLIEHCPSEYYSKDSVISRKSRPQWWPKYLKFIIPIKKLKGNIEQREWTSTLRNLVASCSNFYKVNFFHNVISPNFVQAADRSSVKNKRTRRNRGLWTFKCGTDSGVILKREKSVDSKEPCSNLPNNLTLHKNLVPFVKLYELTKDLPKLVCALKTLKVAVVDIIKYPLKKEKVQERQPYKYLKRHKKLLTRVTHVRLHDLFEKPKDVQYTKDDFLNYLNLGKAEINMNPPVTFNRILSSRILRNNKIPISSDLGRYGLQSKSITNNQVPRKTQRLEWYLREVPKVNDSQCYTVSYSKGQSDEWTHHYTFPKRQQHQKSSQELRLYSQLRKCKPLCVKVERMDLGTIKK